LKQSTAPLISSVDLFCVPTAPRHFTRADLDAEPLRDNSRLGTYTNFVNLLDMCGIAVPTGIRSDGLPASITLLAPSGRDGLTAALAAAVHKQSATTLGATGWSLPMRDLPEEKDASAIDLVVVGAHLSGMPLNGQLKELEARFLRMTTTAADYRLFSLANQTPAKPGLIRCAPNTGTSIEVEVWRLSAAAFGRFVAAIPPPLGIGTIMLSDGSQAKGFIVEDIGLEGASDISAYGGWRAFVDRKTA
jgi:allophanate hydrolase